MAQAKNNFLIKKSVLKFDVCKLEIEYVFNIFNEVFNKHASMKKRFLRSNQGEFLTKEINKAIMTRSRLRNKYLKEKSADSKIAYEKKRNYGANQNKPK